MKTIKITEGLNKFLSSLQAKGTPRGEPFCQDQCESWYCNRIRGHSGLHIAFGDGVGAIWENNSIKDQWVETVGDI